MRSFLLGVLLLPAVAMAQPVTVEKTVVCDVSEKVISEITKKHGEQPIWIGNKPESKIGVLVNSKTATWTVIQFNNKLACVIDSGEGFQVRTESLGKQVRS